jgi:hypothetical protein
MLRKNKMQVKKRAKPPMGRQSLWRVFREAKKYLPMIRMRLRTTTRTAATAMETRSSKTDQGRSKSVVARTM